MTSRQLGPEQPNPFSVLSERHVRQQLTLPNYPETVRYSFGPQYEQTMSDLIHKYLELDTNDRLCYVGEPRGTLVDMLRSKFCLTEPVCTVIPGHIHYEESPNHRMMPIKVEDVGAQDFFHRAASSGKSKYEKVLFKDAVRFLEDPKKTFKDVLSTLSDFGRIVVIQRPAEMNTLPVSSNALNRFQESDQGYLQIIKDLQACNLDVQWEVECLPVVMTKSQWYTMLKDRYPPQMEMMSPFEVTSGLRELSEGIMKYGDDLIEFKDRLLFISASRMLLNKVPSIARYGTPAHVQNPLPPPSQQQMTYEMEVTSDLQPYLKERQRQKRINSANRGYVRSHHK